MTQERLAETAPPRIDLPTLLGRTAEVVVDQPAMQSALGALRLLCGALRDHWVTPREASRLIGDFSGKLTGYFASEDTESYFETMVTDHPALHERVDRLRAEHTEIQGGIDQLVELAEDESRGLEVSSRLSCILDRFETHERGENLLLQEFFLRDDGVGGQ